MFGAFRFILAVLVALSHLGMVYAGFNPGQWAVISFYTLSGLLMERQFQKLSPTGNGIGAFYLDRFLRIYPLYFAVLLLAWFADRASWGDTLFNIALLPVNYLDFINVHLLIIPASSLACEVHFYVFVPLLVLCSIKTLRIILLSSLSLFAISPFLPHASFWAWAGFPGMLFTLASGLLINRKDFLFIKMLWPIMALLLIIFGIAKFSHPGLRTGININVAIGYLVAVIAISWLDRFSPKKNWDKMLGLFSYPLFLCNGIVFDFVRSYFSILNLITLLCAAILFSGLLMLIVEIPFDRIRYRLRAKSPGKISVNP